MFIYYFFLFIIIPKRSFFYITSTIDSSLFFQTLYALLSRYKDRSQFTKQIVPIATIHYVCTRTDHLKYSITARIFTTYHFCPFKPYKSDRSLYYVPLHFCTHVNYLRIYEKNLSYFMAITFPIILIYNNNFMKIVQNSLTI